MMQYKFKCFREPCALYSFKKILTRQLKSESHGKSELSCDYTIACSQSMTNVREPVLCINDAKVFDA